MSKKIKIGILAIVIILLSYEFAFGGPRFIRLRTIHSHRPRTHIYRQRIHLGRKRVYAHNIRLYSIGPRSIIGRTFNSSSTNRPKILHNRIIFGRNRFIRRRRRFSRHQTVTIHVHKNGRRSYHIESDPYIRYDEYEHTIYGTVRHQNLIVGVSNNRTRLYQIEHHSYIIYEDYQYRDSHYDETISRIFSPRQMKNKPETKRNRYYSGKSWYYIKRSNGSWNLIKK